MRRDDAGAVSDHVVDTPGGTVRDLARAPCLHSRACGHFHAFCGLCEGCGYSYTIVWNVRFKSHYNVKHTCARATPTTAHDTYRGAYHQGSIHAPNPASTKMMTLHAQA